MLSYQTALCSRIVKTGDIVSPLKFGLTADDFTEPQAKAFWNTLLAYYQDPASKGSVLDKSAIREHFSQVLLDDDSPNTHIDRLCAEVRRNRVIVKSSELAVRCMDAMQLPLTDPMRPLQELYSGLGELISLGTSANSDVTLETGMDEIARDMMLAINGVTSAVATWPWDVLNAATFGIQPDDYAVFYGRPKSMKTWILIYIIAHLFIYGKKVILYTKEMTPKNVFMRVVACICRMHYTELRSSVAIGTPLSPEDYAEFQKQYKIIKTDPEWKDRIIVLSGRDVPSGGDTVSWLESKVDQYKPDLLAVDGLYLLSDQRKATADHMRVQNISRDLRKLNLDTGVPVAATMQANRKAAGHGDANLDEIAYSDAIGQDSTMSTRVINDKASQTISLVIGGSREFALHGFRINRKPAKDFSFHSLLSEAEALAAKEADAEEKAKKTKKSAKGKEDKGAKPPSDATQIENAIKDLKDAHA
jgi:hypothetical protein